MAYKKVLFRLNKDADGYPPLEVESVWAQDQGDGTFIVDNIPFFAREVALGDVIEVVQTGEELYYKSTIKKSDNSLLRVVLFDKRDPASLRNELKTLGCCTEQSHLESLISVNVPLEVEISKVRAILQEGRQKGWWDYEEPILRQ